VEILRKLGSLAEKTQEHSGCGGAHHHSAEETAAAAAAEQANESVGEAHSLRFSFLGKTLKGRRKSAPKKEG